MVFISRCSVMVVSLYGSAGVIVDDRRGVVELHCGFQVRR